jgi:hypothetical protein
MALFEYKCPTCGNEEGILSRNPLELSCSKDNCNAPLELQVSVPGIPIVQGGTRAQYGKR